MRASDLRGICAATTITTCILCGCSRSGEPASTAPNPPPSYSATPAPSPIASAGDGRASQREVPPAEASTFAVIARVEGAPPFFGVARTPARAHVLVQRTPDGGVVVAYEYARAIATGGGPLTVEPFTRGWEREIVGRPHMVQGLEGTRWVWSDATTQVVIYEEETARTGPRLTGFVFGASGATSRPGVGYFSAVTREGSVLALERRAFEMPNTSMYPKGSGYEANTWSIKPARVAVLAGKGPAPIIPAGVCPSGMAAGADGTLVVLVEKCDDYTAESLGVLRYAPKATQAKVEWLVDEKRNAPPNDGEDVAAAVGNASDILVAEGTHLSAWNGKAWTTDTSLASFGAVHSLSRAPDGTTWAIAGSTLLRRRVDAAWTKVPLPVAPAAAAEPDPIYAVSTENYLWHWVKAPQADPKDQRAAPGTQLDPVMIDASGDEVLVLAHGGREAFVLSTKARSPVARISALPLQRARFAQSMKKRPATASCHTPFFSLPATTTAAMAHERIGATKDVFVGRAVVEGESHVIVYGDDKALAAVQKAMTALGGTKLCGPAVIDETL